ncbi:15767_t:CDS:2 [Gigaspora margarita]|uniref:15767_t:CDS:1 n=1 Tax=Gigaspora margarita TaxID=4874 RepID=A0ABM8W6W5_GIGMA|nr:15767_t:CDS:2 [Gigaspora margarita]
MTNDECGKDPRDSYNPFRIYRNNQNLMDPLVCVDHCADLVFDYAALKGDACLCGNSTFDDYYTQFFDNDSFCNTTCTSDQNFNCGGIAAYRIYRTIHQYHCLWNNGKNHTEKFNMVENKTSMTVEYCMDICKNSGYGCVGLEDGAQCFCGDISICHKGPYTINKLQCSSSCANNSSQICSGPWALSVYKVNPGEN